MQTIVQSKFNSCSIVSVHCQSRHTARATHNVSVHFCFYKQQRQHRPFVKAGFSNHQNSMCLSFIKFKHLNDWNFYPAMRKCFCIQPFFFFPVQGFSGKPCIVQIKKNNNKEENILDYWRFTKPKEIHNAYIQLISIVCTGFWLIWKERKTLLSTHNLTVKWHGMYEAPPPLCRKVTLFYYSSWKTCIQTNYHCLGFGIFVTTSNNSTSIVAPFLNEKLPRKYWSKCQIKSWCFHKLCHQIFFFLFFSNYWWYMWNTGVQCFPRNVALRKSERQWKRWSRKGAWETWEHGL